MQHGSVASQDAKDLLTLLRSVLLTPGDRLILERLDTVMTTQTELTQQIEALTAQSDKARLEVLGRLAALELALERAGTVAPSVMVALAALKASVQSTDDIVADAPVEPPPADPAPVEPPADEPPVA